MLDDVVIETESESVLPIGTLHQPLDILIDPRDKAILALELVSGGEVNSVTVS